MFFLSWATIPPTGQQKTLNLINRTHPSHFNQDYLSVSVYLSIRSWWWSFSLHRYENEASGSHTKFANCNPDEMLKLCKYLEIYRFNSCLCILIPK
jgi:hypothetical protein